MDTPKLRFDGLHKPLKSVTLGELLSFNNGINASKDSYGHGRKFINVLDILNNNFITYKKINNSVSVPAHIEKNNKVEYGDVLFLRSSETREDVGKSSVYLDKSKYALFGGFVIRGKKAGDYNPYYLKLCLESNRVRNQIGVKAGGSTRFNVSQGILSSVIINIPQIEEQKKIADFFSLLDRRIEQQQLKIEALKEKRKGLLQKIFNRELRFKDDNGLDFPEWKKHPLKDLVDRITRKNQNLESTLPLTISAQYGLVDQISFFNKTVASTNLSGYYLLYKGEFAYNKSYSNGYPLGAIKRLENYEKGVLSSLYICFKAKEKVYSDFLNHYFESTSWYKEVAMISVEGARNHGLLNISINDFFDTIHYIPSFREQQKIAAFLNAISNQLEKEKEKLVMLQQQRKGFIQQMFI